MPNRRRGDRFHALTRRYLLRLRGREREHLKTRTPYGTTYLSPVVKRLYERLVRAGFDPVPNLLVGPHTVTLGLLHPGMRLDIEVGDPDGHTARDQFLTHRGWTVVRYLEMTAGADPEGCVADVARRLEDAGLMTGRRPAAAPVAPAWTEPEPDFPFRTLPPPPPSGRSESLATALRPIITSLAAFALIGAATYVAAGPLRRWWAGDPLGPVLAAVSGQERARVTVGEAAGGTLPVRVAARGALVLEVTATGTSRIQIVADGTPVGDLTLTTGTSLTWRAENRMALTAENPAAVRVQVNGQPVAIPLVPPIALDIARENQ